MPSILGLTTDPSPHGLNSNTSTSLTTSAQASSSSSSNNMPASNSHTMGNGQRLDTISKRNHASAREIEALFWRAILDSPEAAKEYMAKDCVMINPLFHPDGDAAPMTQKTEPAIDEILDGVKEGGWTSYRMHGTPEVVEIDLMAVSVLYKMSLYREHGGGGKKAGKKEIEEVNATVSSCWRQVAGGDWVLVSQHCA